MRAEVRLTNPFKTWRPRGKMYSLKCNQCGQGFLSSTSLDAPFCGICIQDVKSRDSTIDYDKKCITCGNQGVIYSKEQCYSCYFNFQNDRRYYYCPNNQ
jgi:ribosomal protein S27E